jgi:CheY-like chemotaxis protein
MSVKIKKYHVLVVEDDPVIASLHENLLTEVGCSVDIAYNAIEAFQHIQNKQPHALVLDLHLPGKIQGPELLGRLRMVFPRLQAVVVTGRVLRDIEHLELDHAGGGPPVAVLPKPFMPAQLVAEILARCEAALRRSRRA